MYHRVAEESFDPWGLAVSPKRFERQVEWLSRHRVVLPLEEFASLLTRDKLPRSAVALTFDDGYACSLRTAAPLLESAGASATIFLPAQLLRRRRQFWWDELGQIVLEFKGGELILDNQNWKVPAPTAEDGRWTAGNDSSTPRQRLYLQLWSALRSRDLADIDHTLDDMRRQGNVRAPNRDAYTPISKSDLSWAVSTCVTFGSHALSHRPLTSLGPGERRREIAESVAACEELTGTAPSAFAYPFGDCDEETAQMVRVAGFLCACTTEPAFVTGRTSPFMIPRLQVGDWEPARLAKALRGQ